MAASSESNRLSRTQPAQTNIHMVMRMEILSSIHRISPSAHPVTSHHHLIVITREHACDVHIIFRSILYHELSSARHAPTDACRTRYSDHMAQLSPMVLMVAQHSYRTQDQVSMHTCCTRSHNRVRETSATHIGSSAYNVVVADDIVMNDAVAFV